MNWGHKITIVFLIFVSGMTFLVYLATQEKQELVTTNYYEKELKYQDKIDAMKITEALSSQVVASHKDGIISIVFPNEFSQSTVKSNILLYCAFNEKNDQEFNLDIENAKSTFAIKTKQVGNYTLKINWDSEGKSYYTEKNIYIQ